MSLPIGKLPLDLLYRLLKRNVAKIDPRVLIGPRLGEDAAVIEFGDTCLVAKTDPITFATDDIGHYAIHVNANDIATMGATPRWFLATILLPEKGTTEKTVEGIFDSLNKAANSIGISICGGHTEVTTGLDRPIIIGQMLGEVKREDLVQSSSLSPGDCMLLTKGLGIEATAIIAREKAKILRDAGISDKIIEQAANYLYTPGISVLKEAQIACQTASINAMHDPTEGGVATALRELAQAADVGMEVDSDALLIDDITRQLCAACQLDPLGVVSSGALLIGVSPSDGNAVCNAIQNEGIPCRKIAQIHPASFGIKLRRNNQLIHLPRFDRDEIGKAFE